jgi:hypothetical protein
VQPWNNEFGWKKCRHSSNPGQDTAFLIDTPVRMENFASKSKCLKITLKVIKCKLNLLNFQSPKKTWWGYHLRGRGLISHPPLELTDKNILSGLFGL